MLRRARSDLVLLVTAWALLVSAIALIAASFALADSVTIGGLRRAVEAVPAADRIVSVTISTRRDEADAIAERVRPALAATLLPSGGHVEGLGRVAGLVLGTDAPAPGSGASAATLLAAFDDLPDHAVLTGGRWPLAGRSPTEAVLSDGAASALGLRAGERTVVADSLDRSRSIPVVVVGTYRPGSADPFWAGSVLEIAGVERRGDITTEGPIVVDRADLLAVAPRDVELGWRLLPDVPAIRVDDVPALRAAIASLADRLGAVLPADTRPGISTGLPAILGDLERSLLVTRTGVALLTLQFGILAGYAIVLVAAILVERRRDGVRLMRARGASAWHVAAMAVIEAVLLVLPAAAVAPLVALAVVDVAGSVGALTGVVAPASIDARMLAATGLSAVACVVALSVPALASVLSAEGLRIVRAGTTTLPQRLGLDLVLVVLAALGLWQLEVYGAPLSRGARGTLGIDPVLVAAPALGLLAGAVLAIRAVPRVAEIVERLVARRRGPVAALGGRQLARRPLRYSRAALLLILAVAFGTYALADSATWLRSQGDQGAYETVGGIRVIGPASADVPAWAVGSTYRSLRGVAAAVPAFRGSVTAGTLRDGRLLGVDAAAAARTGGDGWTSGSSGGSGGSGVAALAAQRLTSASVPLPAGVRRLAVTIDAALSVSSPGPDGSPLPLDAATRAISVAAVVIDADGLVQRLPGADAALGGGMQRVEIGPPLAPSGEGRALAAPVRLEAVEVTFTVPPGPWVASGSVDVGAVEVSEAAPGGGWVAVDAAMAAPAWDWRIAGPRGTSGYSPPAGHPRRILFPLAEPFSGRPGDLTDGLPVTARLLAIPASNEPLPAVASGAFLAATGTHDGDVLAVTADAAPLQLRISGVLDRVAPLDPASASVVVDGPSLALRRFEETGDALEPSEWWLAVGPGAEAGALAAIRASAPTGTSVLGREERTERLRGDPVAAGIIGALVLGALAAVIFAIAGFLVSASASAGERVREFALLEALGLSPRQLRASLVLEDGFLLAVGLSGGVLLGLVLAWVVLPFATLTATGAPPVPPPVVVVPWAAALPLVAAAAGLLVVAETVAMRQLGRRSVGDLLRDWEA